MYMHMHIHKVRRPVSAGLEQDTQFSLLPIEDKSNWRSLLIGIFVPQAPFVGAPTIFNDSLFLFLQLLVRFLLYSK